MANTPQQQKAQTMPSAPLTVPQYMEAVEAVGGKWALQPDGSVMVGMTDDGEGFPKGFWPKYAALKQQMGHIEDLPAAIAQTLQSA